MRVALVHDSLTQFGGAERVLQALHEIFPQAPVFTLVYDKKLKDRFGGWTIVTSPLQHLYNCFPRFQYLLPLIPLALRFFDFSKYDLVISSSSVFAKGIKVPKRVLHINYCHTPARFLWVDMAGYLDEELPWLFRPFRKFAELYLNLLKIWDFKIARKVDCFIANSANTKERIKKFYGRDSAVIYPYIDCDFFHPSAPKSDYFLVGGRLQAHKRVDLVVKAFNETGDDLHVVGTGRAEPALKEASAASNISFYGKVDDAALRDQYSGAIAFIFPQEEDFGIMPLEAMACGTPVMAYARGGALETITEKTGVFFEKQETESIKEAAARLKSKTFNAEDLFERAAHFSKERFKREIKVFVDSKLSTPGLKKD